MHHPRSEQQLVNWCPALQSAISDMEVEHVEVEGRREMEVEGCTTPVTFGVMWHLVYREEEGEGEVVVATTRPETMLGDTAVAVHPEDPRYTHLHGKRLLHPFRGLSIPVVADASVAREVGSGAVKVTPAHDRADWEVAARHGLESVQVIGKDGRILAGRFAGLHRLAARAEVLAALAELGLVAGEEEHAMAVPVCSRTGDVVEPMVTPQWFLDTAAAGGLAARALRDGDLAVAPARCEAAWAELGEGGRPWCLSRQLWWGHQVPAYSCTHGTSTVWVAAMGEEEAKSKAAALLHLPAEQEGEVAVARDQDVLDTWFSSALYPFAALGWPEDTPELAAFYPLDLMETGHDIQVLWVQRMVMLGIALTSALPFPEVLLHGIVTDQQGRKMSKSLGNVMDPLHLLHGASLEELEAGLGAAVAEGVLEAAEAGLALAGLQAQWPGGVPASGADPLRWALASYDLRAQSFALEPSVVRAAGAWCNKVWQVSRLLQLAHTRAAGRPVAPGPGFAPGLMDMWVLGRLAAAVDRVNRHWEARELHLVTRELRAFVYTDLCDTYVEYIKPSLADPESEEFLPSLLILHRWTPFSTAHLLT